MKISAQDEYGIRVLIRIAKSDKEDGMSLPQLSEAEGISSPYMAKITRALRMAGFIQSTRGYKGGYVLSKSPKEIKVGDVLKAMDGALFDERFCNAHTGESALCTNSVDCSVRSLWRIIQHSLDQVLEKITLEDLVGTEDTTREHLLEKTGLTEFSE
jgi:Rrf2 family protein